MPIRPLTRQESAAMPREAPHPRPSRAHGGQRALAPVPTGIDVLWGAAALVSMAVCGAGAVILSHAVGGTSVMVLTGLFGATVGAYLPLWFGVIRRRQWSWRDLGFQRPRHHLGHLLWQMPLIMMASLIATIVLAAFLSVSPAGTSSSTSAFDGGWPLAVGATLFTVVALPLAEEIIFRRLLLDWLLARTPVALAVAVVTVAFAAIHVAPPVMLYILVSGGFWTVLRVWYGSLWASWIPHMCNNALVVLLVL